MRICKIIYLFLFSVTVTKAQINVKARIDHVVPDGTDTLGNIYLTVTGGTSPYTYTWTPGGSTSMDLTNATAKSYTVKVRGSGTDSVFYKYKLGYKMRWINTIAMTNRNDSLFGITTTPPNPMWDQKHTLSRNTLKYNQDGWVQWLIVSTAYSSMLGFLDSASVAYTGVYGDIDHGLYQSGNNIYYLTGGGYTLLTSCAVGDVMRIERIGNALTFYKNSVSIKNYTTNINNRDWKLKVDIYSNQIVANVGASFADSTGSNFPNYVEDIPFVTHCSPGSSNGSVKLTPAISGSSHSYTWSTGANTNSISSQATGNYSVTIADGNSNTSKYNYNIAYKTYWGNGYYTRFRNDSVQIVSPGSITGYNTSLSRNTLAAGADGWAEIIVRSLSEAYMIGFLDSASVIPGVWGDIDYGAYLNTNRLSRIVGGGLTLLNSYKVGDVIRIERIGSTFYLKINGFLQYSGTCSTGAWKLKVALNNSSICHVGASFTDTTNTNFPTFVDDIPLVIHCTPGINNGSVKLSPRVSGATRSYTWSPGGATTSSITSLATGNYSVTIADGNSNTSRYNYNVGYKTYWTDGYFTSLRNDTLLLVSPYSPTGWNTSISKNTLNSGTNGWVEFVAKSLNDEYMIGYADSCTLYPGTYADIDYGIYMHSRNIYRIWNGATAYIGGLNTGDVIRLERTGSTFYIKQNGIVVSSISVSTGKPWKIKAALNNASISYVGSSFADTTNVSFPNYVAVTYGPVHSDWEANNGSITLTPSYPGTYTYSWNPYETTNTITGKDPATYSVIVTDPNANSSTYSYTLGYKLNWSQLSGMTLSGDTLISTGGSWNAAASSNTLAANTDGWMEYIVNTRSYNQVFGFLDTVLTMGTYTDIDYGIYLEAYSRRVFLCQGGSTSLLWSFNIGDVIRIERVGATVKYKLNGVQMTSVSVPTVTLNKAWRMKSMVQNGGARIVGPGTSVPLIQHLAYAKLKKYLDGGFYDITTARNPFSAGKLNFVFEEEYLNNGNNLTCTIYKMDRSMVPVTSLVVSYKDNRYTLNLPVVLSPTAFNKYYIMEVVDKKGEKAYLRFKY